MYNQLCVRVPPHLPALHVFLTQRPRPFRAPRTSDDGIFLGHLAAPCSWGSWCVYYYLYDNNTAAGCTRTPIRRVPECISTGQDDFQETNKMNQSETVLIPPFNPKKLSWSLDSTPQCNSVDEWKNLCTSYFCLNLLHSTHLAASIMHALLCCKQIINR